MTDTITTRTAGPIAYVTLNRPERLNAIGPALVEDFLTVADELERAAEAGEIRVAVLTGEGRAFCAGGDLKDAFFTDTTFEQRRPVVARGYRLIKRLRELPIPLVAGIQGACAGAGVTIAAACDLRVAAEDAMFSLDFVRVGLLPDMGTTYLLPHLLGTGRAMELALLAERIDATEAERIGLVNRVVAAGELHPELERMAERLAGMGPLGLRLAKRAIYQVPNLPVDDGFKVEADFINYLIGTADCREGVTAFAERRTPAFSGE